jgi:molecular chaperone Hsp33
LLYRLFHENGVRVFDEEPVRAQCRCSRDRILSMLKGFSPQQRTEMMADDGMIGVTCDFCSKRYVIAPHDIEALSSPEGVQSV